MILVEVRIDAIFLNNKKIIGFENGVLPTEVSSSSIPQLTTEVHSIIHNKRTYAALTKSEMHSSDFEVFLAVDERLDFTVVRQILMSLGQAEISTFHFCSI